MSKNPSPCAENIAKTARRGNPDKLIHAHEGIAGRKLRDARILIFRVFRPASAMDADSFHG